MALFGPKTAKGDDFFAIDVGASSVKVLQLRRKTGKLSLVGLGSSPINRAILADKTVLDIVKLSEVISEAVQTSQIKSKTAYTVLPSSQTISKTFTIPSGMNSIEEEDFIYLEAQNHISERPEHLRMDYEITGLGENNTLQIHLVATKIDQFQMMVDAVTTAGFDLKIMDIDNLAIVRAINYLIQKNPLDNVDEPNEILVDLGHEFTNIFALRQGRCIFTREQNFGMKQLVEEISRVVGITISEAENVLIHEAETEILRPVMAQFRSETANQVNRLIQLFFANSSYNRVHRIWLSGGGAVMNGLTQDVAEMTGVPTRQANPLLDVDTPKHLDSVLVHKLAPTFLTAFGLAIRED